MNVLLLLPLLVADASATTKAVTLCARIATDFTDPGGDFWVDNDDRRARGAHVVIDDDDLGVKNRWLDDDGCLNVVVTASTDYDVTVYSEALVNGIDLLSYKVTCNQWLFEECISQSEALVSHTTIVPISKNAPEVVVYNANQAWYNLVVGMRAFYRNDMNLGTYSSRGCCDDDQHDWWEEDGTCVYDTGEGKDPNADEPDLYGEWDDSTEILFFWEDWSGAGCCSSRYQPSWESAKVPAVKAPFPWKFIIAHELGHVVVMERMGGRTSDDLTAENCKCMGNYTTYQFDSADPWANAADPDDDGKAALTMEYQSCAAREGWGNFYSSWMWNSRFETDCTYDTHVIHDFDLDGDIDNNYDTFGDYNEADSYDGVYNCEGYAVIEDTRTGHSGPVPTGDALESYYTGRDWLEDMVDEGVCGYDDDDGETGDTDHPCHSGRVLLNRSTQYDWHRFLWDMLTDEDIDPDKLADMYVDMCPTNWAKNDDEAIHDDLLPVKRLEFSADHHNEATAWSTWKNNGQDH